MIILINLLYVLLGIVCLMLIGLVLLQRSKGQGTGLSFGGGGAEAIFGAQMGNVLTRATVVLGILFLVIVIGLTKLAPSSGGGSVIDTIEKEARAALPAPTTSAGAADYRDFSDAPDFTDFPESVPVLIEEEPAPTSPAEEESEPVTEEEEEA